MRTYPSLPPDGAIGARRRAPASAPKRGLAWAPPRRIPTPTVVLAAVSCDC